MTSACSHQTDEEKIARINKSLAPEGYVTKTDLYISWPTIQHGLPDNIAPPLRLKIPLKYLAHGLFWDGDPYDLDSAITLYKKEITFVALRFMPEAEPIIPSLYYPVRGDTKEAEAIKAKYFNRAYTVFINREISLSPENYHSTNNTFTEKNIAGLERYIPMTCYDLSEIKQTSDIDHQKALLYFNGKAKDDLSPSNCYTERELQFFQSPPDTPYQDSVYITCPVLLCKLSTRLQKHTVEMVIADESPFGDYQLKMAEHVKKTKDRTYHQPLLNEIWTDIPRWRERYDPTMKLLNSFIMTESDKSL